MLDLDLGAGFGCSDHNFSEFFFRLQTIGQADGVGEFCSVRRRFRSEFSAGDDDILCPDGIDDLGNGDTQLGQPVRFDPDPHGIIRGPNNIHTTDAFDPGQHILDIDEGIVV